MYYRSLRDLAPAAPGGGNQGARLLVLAPPALLVVDEIAYLPVSPNGAPLCFRLINARSERAATGLTSTRGSRSGKRSSGTRWWRRPSSIGCSTAATSRRSEGTATGYGGAATWRSRSGRFWRGRTPDQDRLPSRDAPVRRHVRRARVPDRSAPSVRARRAHPGTHPPPPIRPQPLQIPSTHPSAGTQSPRKSGTFSTPGSGTFSTPFDTHSSHRLTSKPVIQSRKAKTNAVSKVSVLHTEFLTVLDRSRN